MGADIPSIILLNIVAGVCLLLWGVMLLRLGVTRGFGASLRRFLAACTNNRLKAFAAGIGMTALLQSSTATVLVVSSFASQGLLNAATGIAIVLGADVGTTLVAQLFSLDISLLLPAFLVAGYILFKMENNGKLKNIGRILIGLALMLLALNLIREGASPLRESETLPLILAPLEQDPFFAVLLAALMTWIAHSSLAIVLLLMSLVTAGVLPLELGLFMVLGANLGGTIAPLIATLKDNPDAMRIPLGNMLIRVTGIVAIVPFLPFLMPPLADFDADEARQLVNFHTGFNVALALAFLPFTGLINELLKRALPDRPVAYDPGRARYLSEKDLDTPSVALSNAARETLRMAEMIQQMLTDAMRAMRTNNEKLVGRIKEEDNIVDQLYSQIKNYMARMAQEFMDKREAQRYVQILMFSTNLEHAGDVIDKNLLPLVNKKIRNQVEFSAEGLKEIQHIHDLVLESIKLAQSIFDTGDTTLARRLLADKDIIRNAEIKGFGTHIERLRDGVPETVSTSSLHLDIIRDYRRINSYMCAVAYPLLENEQNQGG
jgi:phosphate:Na+ symporter